ncbi:MAG: hypothetical protein LBM75_00455 [Myxococcales bacterium]|jgi:hypothetical protein|nr:hypothetical protein [Myxococcales bacterium]
MKDALQSIASMIDRSERAREKFAEGTPQHTLQKNRIHALKVARSLISENGVSIAFEKDELKRAIAPIDSLMSKSDKALTKLAPGSWQHAMLTQNVRALRLALPLIEKALGE